MLVDIKDTYCMHAVPRKIPYSHELYDVVLSSKPIRPHYICIIFYMYILIYSALNDNSYLQSAVQVSMSM